MNGIKRVWMLYRDVFWGDPAQTQYEREQREQRVRAREEAEAEYHRKLAEYYTQRVLSLDPDTHWWEFAEAKQKQYEHQCDCMQHERRAAGIDDFTDIPTLARAVRRQTTRGAQP